MDKTPQNQTGESRDNATGVSRLPAAAAIPSGLTHYQRREIRRRQRKLNQVAELIAAGLSEEKAAKLLRLSTASLWRWRRGLVPATNRCGRHPIFARFKITERLVSKVQKLVVAGCSHEKAWRALADDPHCPKELAEFLRQSATIPPSFLAASRLNKIRIIASIGINFTHIPQPLNSP